MFDFLNALQDALSSVVGEIEQLVVFLFEALISVFQFLGSLILGIFGYQGQVNADIGSFFGETVGSFFKSIFSAILKGIVKFGAWLAAIFGPILKHLRQISQYIDRLYRTYVVPILRWIRLARLFLTLLKALGVKWAKKLDAILGTIQNDIQRAFLTIRGYLNILIDLANILADPTMLLRRPTTLLSIMRISRAAVRMFTGLPPGFFFPSPVKGAPLGLGFTGKGFDPSDPLQNPPPSYYLAFDGGVGDFSGLDPGTTIPDDAADSLQPWQYFTDSAWDVSPCVDPVACQAEAARLALQGA